MSRNFIGQRTTGGSDVSLKVIRNTLRKGGRINEDTFRKIVKGKLDEARANMGKKGYNNSMFGNKKKNKRRKL